MKTRLCICTQSTCASPHGLIFSYVIYLMLTKIRHTWFLLWVQIQQCSYNYLTFLKTASPFVSWPVEKGGVGNCVISQHPTTPIPMGHAIKTRTHTCWEITSFAMSQPSGTRDHKATASWFFVPRRLPFWNFVISQQTQVLAIMLHSTRVDSPAKVIWKLFYLFMLLILQLTPLLKTKCIDK